MIVGWRDKDVNTKEWHPVFVIFPRRMMCGRWVFLQEVLRCDYMAHCIPVYGTHCSLFGWVYKEKDTKK